tara:strand:- start:480 stop:1022 length:543 start_codon:yes stop_codon:yes gene_type:complete
MKFLKTNDKRRVYPGNCFVITTDGKSKKVEFVKKTTGKDSTVTVRSGEELTEYKLNKIKRLNPTSMKTYNRVSDREASVRMGNNAITTSAVANARDLLQTSKQAIKYGEEDIESGHVRSKPSIDRLSELIEKMQRATAHLQEIKTHFLRTSIQQRSAKVCIPVFERRIVSFPKTDLSRLK